MKFRCDRSALVDKLGVLARGVSTRSALPVLSGILLQAGEGRLDLFSTDMELSIKATLATPIERDGEIVVPARLFTDVVRNLPDEDVVIEAGEAAVKVSAGRAAFSLNAWAAADFPQTSTFDMEDAFSVGRDPFVETLNKVGRAASRDETRPILTGVLMTIVGDTLKMVATDSYRLAVKETTLAAPAPDLEAIVPSRALQELSRIASGSGEIAVGVQENQVFFSVDGVWLTTRRIDGQFPNYRQLLPETFEHELTMPRAELLDVVRRAAVMIQRATPLQLRFAEGEITVAARTHEVGESRESMPVAYTGEPLEIGFNAEFLREGLESVEGDDVHVKLISPLRPAVLTDEGGDFTYLVMPIRLPG